MLVSGKCETDITTKEEKVFKTTIYSQPGEFFGELALLNNAPRAATVQAITDVVVLSINLKTFRELLKPIVNEFRQVTYEVPPPPTPKKEVVKEEVVLQ